MFKSLLNFALICIIAISSARFTLSHGQQVQTLLNGLGLYGEIVSKAPIFHLDTIEEYWEKFTSYTPVAQAYSYFTEGDLLTDAKAKAVQVKETVSSKFAIDDQVTCKNTPEKFFYVDGVLNICITKSSSEGK